MNKKFLSAILFGALTAASTSTFVSCKDYDDDIQELQEQINQNASTAASELAAKVASLESQISKLNAAREDLASQLAAAKSEAAVAAANALAAAQTAQAAADAAKTGGDAAAAAAAKANELAQKGVDGAAAAQATANAAATAAANAQTTADKGVAAAAAAKETADKAIAEITATVARVATLETKITNLESIVADLNASKAELNTKVSDLQTQMAAVKADTKANADAIAAANAAILAKATELSGEIAKVSSALGARIDVVDATLNSIQANYATKDELNTKANELAAMDAQLNNQIAVNSKFIETLQATVKDLAAKDAELAGKIESNYNALLDKINAMNVEQANMLKTIEALQAASNELKTQYSALSSAKADLTYVDNINNQLTTLINSLQKTLNDLTASDASQAQTINTLLQDVSGLKDKTKDLQDLVAKNAQASDKALQDAIAQLQSEMREAGVASDAALGKAVNDIKALVEENAAEIAAIKEDLAKKADQAEVDALIESLTFTQADVMNITLGLTELKGDVAAQKDELMGLIADAEKAAKDYAYDLILKLTDLVNANTGNIASNQEAINGLLEAIEDLSDMANGRLSDFVTSAEQTEALDDLYNGIQEQLIDYVKIVDLKRLYADREEMNASLNELKEAIEAHETTYNTRIEAIEGEVESLKAHLTDLGLVNERIAKRLTSITFLPEEHIDGIPVINFTTLKYNELIRIGSEAYRTGGATYVTDTLKQVRYRLNPQTVAADGFEMPYYVDIESKNQTRAAASQVAIKKMAYDESNGIMTLNVAKSGTASLPIGEERFYMSSLAVPVAEKYLIPTTEGEAIDATVYSEYVRLNEEEITPHIAKYIRNSTREANTADKHFYTINEVEAGIVSVECYWADTINLLNYVGVSKDNHSRIVHKNYGLTYRFYIADKAGLNEQGVNNTDNQDFGAMVNEYGLFTCKVPAAGGMDEIYNNRAAVGRLPIVRAELRDTVNNKLVEVKYFKVEITDKEKETINLGNIKDFGSFTGSCSADWNGKLTWAEVNRIIYAQAIKDGGISFLTFIRNYELKEAHVSQSVNGRIYGSTATVGTDPTTCDVWMTDVENELPAATEIIGWNIDNDDLKFMETNVNKFTLYIVLHDPNGNYGQIEFSMNVTANKPAAPQIYRYAGTQWYNDNTMFKVSPRLYSDSNNNCYYTTNLLWGFIKNGAGNDANDKPSTVAETLKGLATCGDADLIFNQKSGYEVKADGKELWHKATGTLAASINSDYEIILGDVDGEPTDGAKYLLNEDNGDAPVLINYDLGFGGNMWQNYYAPSMNNYVVKKYDVHFIQPIKNAGITIEKSLRENILNGDVLNIANAVEIKDWNEYYVRETAYSNPSEFQKYAVELYAYYGIESITWDMEGVKTNLSTKNGSYVPIAGKTNGNLPPYATLTAYDAYGVETTTGDNAVELKYTTDEGSAVSPTSEYEIYVPIKVTYKWGVADFGKATIKVQPRSMSRAIQ